MYKLRVALLLTVASVTQASSWGLSHNLTDNKDVNNMVKWAESQLNKLLKDFGNNTTFWRAVEKLRQDPQYDSSKRCFEAYKNIPMAQWGPLIDASAKPAAGLKNGAIVWMGSYKQCQSLPNTHFCTFNNIFLNNNTQAALNIGLCIPQDCGTKDITGILQTLMYLFHISSPKARIHIDRNNQSIQTYGADSFCMKKDTEYSTGSYVMISVCVVLAALCILGTIVELTVHFLHNKANSTYILYVDEEDDKLTQSEEDRKKEEDNKHLNISMHAAHNESGNKYANFMMCFSLVKNTKAILNTDIPKGAITSINGIRVISITWVIMGHSLLFDMGTFNNMLTVFGWAKRFTMQALINATVSVDTFFLLSGLLVGYLSMKRYVKIGSLPLVRYYVHRYIRLTPSYLVMILFFTFVYPFLSNGPFWYMQGPNTYQAKMCRENWWSNILYINNFYPDLSKMCVGWSWYLANDMQFYVVSPIILYLMHRFKLIGTFVTNGVLLLACFICNGVLLYVDQSSPVFFDGTQLFNSGMMDYMQHIYMKPYTRIGTYLVGLVLGYILVHKPKPYAGKYKYLFHLGGWAIAIATGLAVIYGPYSQTKHPWSRVEVQFYGILFRFSWVVAVAWVIYACHVGYGGLINDILSWKAFIPLSRLTYSTYLVHPMAINFFFASLPSALYMTEITFAYLFVAITVFSYVAAFILSVCVEYPVFNLEKLFFDF